MLCTGNGPSCDPNHYDTPATNHTFEYPLEEINTEYAIDSSSCQITGYQCVYNATNTANRQDEFDFCSEDYFDSTNGSLDTSALIDAGLLGPI